MKRWLPAVAGVIMLIFLIGLSVPVIEPEDFTGIWYSSQDAAMYTFENGLIFSWDPSKERQQCGAYSFCADSVFLFVLDVEGLETEQELMLIRDKSGDRLVGGKNGNGITYFQRSLGMITGT